MTLTNRCAESEAEKLRTRKGRCRGCKVGFPGFRCQGEAIVDETQRVAV